MIGKGYQKGEIVQDFTEGFAISIFAGMEGLKPIESKFSQTIFESLVSIGGAIGALNLIKSLSSFIETPEAQQIPDIDQIILDIDPAPHLVVDL